MNEHFWWHLSRASGIVAWGLLLASSLWGILLATRLLRPYDRPAWLRDLHTWLGAITVLGTGLHVAAIVADSYVHFGLADVAVPLASSWKPVAVAWGIVGAYLLAAVQASSLLMRRIPRRAWRAIHLTSYALFASVSVHAFTAGTDRTADAFQAFGIAVVTVMLGATVLRTIHRGSPRARVVVADAA